MNQAMWNDQLEFNKRFFADQQIDLAHLTSDEKTKWTIEFYFQVTRQLVELMNRLPHWKVHIDDADDAIVQSNISESYIDALKYFMGLGQILGLTYEDVCQSYDDKTRVVEQRYAQQKSIKQLRDRLVVVFDIDGVLNNYPQCLIDWINADLNVQFKSRDEIKTAIGLERYEKEKEAYRLSGAKRQQPINYDSVDALRKLKEKYDIVLYTARPVRRYSQIYSDTLQWLSDNSIPFDAIFWSNLNKEDVFSLKLKIKFAVEDDHANAASFNEAGIRVYLLDTQFNQGYSHPLTTRIKHASEVLLHENSRRAVEHTQQEDSTMYAV
jgi:uncharacterized HAD superfamily protein